MSEFKIHEVATGQNHIYDTALNGMECEIIEGLQIRRLTHKVSGLNDYRECYRVKWANGKILCAQPGYLRKKKPPQEKMGDWELIEIGTGWSPFKVTAPKEKQSV